MDDFDYLGSLDDSYLNSLFEEENTEASSNIFSSFEPHNYIPDPQEIFNNEIGTEASVSPEASSVAVCSAGIGVNGGYENDGESDDVISLRSNPPRIAKIGVQYHEFDEEDDMDAYYCWKCEILVTVACEKHGPLLPCCEHITSRGTKNPDKFPTPSFVEIRDSGIPGAGKGVFATKFIKPGQIVGEYKGKKISENEYKKLEMTQKESGYAWKTYGKDGKPLYIDGSNYQSSNWLRFVNCARGKCEENIMVRTLPGKIEYYTFKPVAIGTELLVFYGNGYFTDLGYLVEEDEPEIGDKFHCLQCFKLFKTDSELQQHKCGTRRQRRDEKEKKFTCTTCSKSFTRNGSLRLHIRVVHEKIKRLSCPYCHYRTNDSGNMKRHMKIHSGEKRFRCTHCNYTASQQIALTLHVSTHHTNKMYKCQYMKCGVKRTSQEELYQHIRSDHPVLQYQCDTCPMSFSNSSHLTRHKLTHSKDSAPHQCEYCNKRFTSSSDLAKHHLTHTGYKPHKCSVCEKGFKEPGHLRRHMRIHTGEKPFSCSYCSKKFRFTAGKSNHEIICKSK